MTHQLTLTDEELQEVEQVLESTLKTAMIEVRRSEPNSRFKANAIKRVETINHILDVIKAEHAKPAV